jgi:hypothetical protein
MKAFVGLSLAVLAGGAIAQNESQAPSSSVTGPAPESGSIIMYRGSSIVGAAVACPIRYKNYQIVELGRGKYAEWSVPAGRYILGNGTTSVEVNVAPGERRYIRCQIKMGMLSGRADLQIVDEENFAQHRADYAQKQVTSPF